MTNLWNQDDNRASSHYVRYDLQGHSHTGHSGVDNAPNKWVTFSSIKPKLVWIIWRFTDCFKNILISKSLKIDITHMQTFYLRYKNLKTQFYQWVTYLKSWGWKHFHCFFLFFFKLNHLRFFDYVNEAHLFHKPTYSTFISLLNNYHYMTGTSEYQTSSEDTEVTSFLSQISQTNVIKLTQQFLHSKGRYF